MTDLKRKAETYLRILCEDIGERCVGSEGNRQATRYAEDVFLKLGWKTETPEFDAMDWIDGGAELSVDGEHFDVLVSPYSLGCSCNAPLLEASCIEELETMDALGAVILLHGEIAKEQLMPKGFVFYNPEEHQRIVRALESSGAKALVCATGRNAALAGGVYPFPLIEDGEVDIPSVYMTEEEGLRLLKFVGKDISLHSDSTRVPGKGCNVIARKGPERAKKIVISAHIDAKKGTPGAIDNATGVIVLFLLADMLKDYKGKYQIELLAFNGEDYWAVPGQMDYVRQQHDQFVNMLLNINIDGGGFHKGDSYFSFFDLPEDLRRAADAVIAKYPGISEGKQWAQGDHSIFVQFGVPAIAVTSCWFLDHIDDQDITHTQKDNPDIVSIEKVLEIAAGISELITWIKA